ncbi:MAG: hypothetical protein IT378_22180 [Sandaracinaceae bacterium]|nr:hypothetical protein [Sandaracinaceae bacterium]
MRLGYETIEERDGDAVFLVSGLAIEPSGVRLSRFVQKLDAVDSIAELGVAAEDDYSAALYAMFWIAFALERAEHVGSEVADGPLTDEAISPEREARLIRASLGSLRSFRDTGEP